MDKNSPAFNKSADTRFKNNQIDAAKATMPMNQAAQASLKKQVAPKTTKKTSPPVGKSNPAQIIRGFEPPTQGNVALPTGGPQGSTDLVQDFDPGVFAEEKIGQLVGEIRLNKLIESPRVKDAMTSIRISNIMNATKPDRLPNPKPLFQQVMDRAGLGQDDGSLS